MARDRMLRDGTSVTAAHQGSSAGHQLRVGPATEMIAFAMERELFLQEKLSASGLAYGV